MQVLYPFMGTADAEEAFQSSSYLPKAMMRLSVDSENQTIQGIFGYRRETHLIYYTNIIITYTRR